MNPARWTDPRDRIAAAAAVAAVHGLLLFLLIWGLGVEPAVKRAGDSLKLFEVPPPAIPERRPAQAEPNPEGRTSAQKAVLPVPPPVVTLPSPEIPSGGPVAVSASPGSGAGVSGQDAGAGGEGSGTGGRLAIRARQIGGRITDADYPRAARRAGAEGVVSLRFTVDADGRARDCAIVQSSGDADLDSTTCRLVERRFRYEPARDAQGRAVLDRMAGQQSWWIRR